ncbi:MAG TPA: Trm112 family protein [Myxococcaceae bacterium]|nr:Trm112 family protein [Myxococcaceae bacterium]
MISPSDLEALKPILACPKCRLPSTLEFDIPKAEIRCTHCRLAYPIQEGVPVMLISEAKPLV